MAPHFTLERHLSPIPSPNGTAPHARGTFLPHSVAQRCISARSGNTSVPFRRLTAPRRTLGEHFCPFPSPNSTTTHARATLQPRSVAQQHQYAHLGDTYAHSVARWHRTARSGNTSTRFRSPRVPRRTPGRHFSPVPSPGRAGQGKRTGGWGGGRAGGRHRNGNGHKKGAPDVMRRPGLPEARRRPTLPTGVSVPSARAGLTALFGMGRGGTPRLKPPRISLERSQRDNDN